MSSASSDPSAVGAWLLSQHHERNRRRRKHLIPLSEVAEAIPWGQMPTAQRDYSASQLTAAQYRRECEENPSRHAQAMLRALDGEELDEDPGGS